jgi:hypothetical protein
MAHIRTAGGEATVDHVIVGGRKSVPTKPTTAIGG